MSIWPMINLLQHCRSVLSLEVWLNSSNCGSGSGNDGGGVSCSSGNCCCCCCCCMFICLSVFLFFFGVSCLFPVVYFITACAVATSSCITISDVPFQWER